ncbi:MAG: YetF domain-containing protein [Solirubrobacteraceae bacterium]
MDLVIRATVVFFFIFLVTRIVGRRQLSDLEPFDFILLVVLGDLVQQGITQSDESVTGTLIVISTIALLSVGVSWISFRSSRARLIAEGEPIVLVQDGRPIERNLRRERITLADIQEEARQAQIASLADIHWAILENDGKISCIPRSD